MNLEIILALKQRAKEMLNNNYERKIGDEELYTIICEWENCFKELDKTCLHCEEGKPAYCEKCYQELIAKDMKLQTKVIELEKERDGIYEDYQDLGKEKLRLEEELESKECTGKPQDIDTCREEKMGCVGCHYNKEAGDIAVIDNIDLEKFKKLVADGVVTVDYDPFLYTYNFTDIQGNKLIMGPNVYKNIVDYLEKGVINGN